MVPITTHRSLQFSIASLGNPFLLESFALSHFCYILVADGFLQILHTQSLHSLTKGFENSGLVASIGDDLLAFRLEDGLVFLKLLIGDHRPRGQTVESSFQLSKGGLRECLL